MYTYSTGKKYLPPPPNRSSVFVTLNGFRSLNKCDRNMNNIRNDRNSTTDDKVVVIGPERVLRPHLVPWTPVDHSGSHYLGAVMNLPSCQNDSKDTETTPPGSHRTSHKIRHGTIRDRATMDESTL